MGYWDKDGSYVYDENDIVKKTEQELETTGDPSFDERMDFAERQKSMNPFGEPIKTTGGPGFDERMDFAERQKSMNPFGEPIKTTGGPSFDERMDFAERQKSMNPFGEPIKTTGGPGFDERMDFAERQKSMNPFGEPIKTTGGPSFDERMDFAERQKSMNPFGEPIKTTGGSGFDERMNDSIAQVQYARERDKEKFATLNALMNNLPSNSEDLRLAFAAMDHRLDLMKKLVEHYKGQFLNVAVQYKENYSPEASEIVNNKLTQYLCLIETLKSDGYTFGSERNSYINNSTYDPYKPDVELEEIMSIMHVRRKNDADVGIIFPVNYDLTDQEFQNKGDAVTIINTVNEHLKNNEYMAAMWKKAGYIDEEQEIKRGL